MISRATVVGAGVVGLAMARGLERLGVQVSVLERSVAPRQDGAGLTLWPNALHALDTIDAGDEVRAIGEPVRLAMLLRANGQPLTELPIPELSRRHGPLLAVHRAALTQKLTEGLRDPVHHDVNVTVVGGQVLVEGQRLISDLIVAADGIDSTVRRAFVRGVKPRRSGQFAERGVARTGVSTPSMISESWGPGLRFGMVALQGGLTYWFAAGQSVSAVGNPRHTFAGWHPEIDDVLSAPQVGHSPVLPLLDLPKLRTWHDGVSKVLVGDAAHAMTPNLGQGAAQGLEDVAVLLQELARLPVPQALVEYQRRRKHRAEQMVTRSRLAGWLSQGSHPVVAMLRDGVVPLLPRRAMAHQLNALLSG